MMSNIINNTTSVSSTSSGYGTSRGVEDICLGSLISSPTQASPYDKIIDMIKGLDLQDDGILMNHKIKSIEIDFCNIVRDENMLSESMDYINHKALSDGDTSLKFALLFSSRNFDSLAMNDTKVRSKMLKILEQNYQSAEIFRIENKDRLYNSITLLGEYYHRVRLADNVPIAILGESLLGLLIREICENDNLIDIKLARLILSQITLNGDIMRVQHMGDLTQLLYHVRRNLIEQPSLQPNVKALLLMTLDLYYSNFSNLGHQLEEMYTKYLVDESNNNSNINSCDDTADETENLSANDSFQNATGVVVTATATTDESQIGNYENGCGSSLNDSISGDLNTSEPKKWSEQVCEESFLENEYCNNQFTSIEDNNLTSSNNQLQQQQYQNNNFQQNIHQQETTEFNSISGVGSGGVGDEKEFYVNADINSYHPHSSQQLQPQQLSNQQQNQYKSFSPDRSHSSSSKQNRSDVSTKQSQQPRWRIPRFNRGSSEQDERFISNTNNNRHNNRRLSGNFDDDHNSVRSEGGSIRLYSVNDRLKHLQDKMERETSSHNHHHHHHHGGGGGNHYHSNSSNSWDHGRNFDRNNRNRGSGNGGGRGNFRHTYNRPPRFMKKNNQLSSMDGNNGGDHHHPPPQQQQQQWRSSSGNNASTMSSSYHEDESYAATVNNGGTTNESHSRSSSRARTLPRPPKTNYNDKNNRRSQSPIYNNKIYNNDRGYNNNSLRHHGKHYNNNDNNQQQQQQHYRPQHSRNFNHRNPRYSSQSSLASETSSTLDRRHLRRNYVRNNNQQHHQQHQHQQPDNNATTHDWEDTHSLHGQPEESNWNSKDNNRELVLNARNTTKYMNYLSQK